MQRVTVLCVGKLKEKFYLEAAAEYVKRLQRFCKLELVELPESRLPESPSPAEVQRALAAEAVAIRERFPKRGAGREPEAAGGLAAVHVPHDLPPPSGPDHAAGADLSGVSNLRRNKISQMKHFPFKKIRDIIQGHI